MSEPAERIYLPLRPTPLGSKQRRPLVFLVFSTCLYEMQCDSHPIVSPSQRVVGRSALAGAAPYFTRSSPGPAPKTHAKTPQALVSRARRGHACRAGRAGRPAGCSPPPPVRAEYVRFLNFPNAGARASRYKLAGALSRGPADGGASREEGATRGYPYRVILIGDERVGLTTSYTWLPGWPCI